MSTLVELLFSKPIPLPQGIARVVMDEDERLYRESMNNISQDQHTQDRIMEAAEECDLTMDEVCAMLNVSPPTARRHLRALQEQGMIVRIGPPCGHKVRVFYRKVT